MDALQWLPAGGKSSKSGVRITNWRSPYKGELLIARLNGSGREEEFVGQRRRPFF